MIPDCLYVYYMGAEGLTWGRVTPVEESIRHTRYMRQAGAESLSTKEGRRAPQLPPRPSPTSTTPSRRS